MAVVDSVYTETITVDAGGTNIVFETMPKAVFPLTLVRTAGGTAEVDATANPLNDVFPADTATWFNEMPSGTGDLRVVVTAPATALRFTGTIGVTTFHICAAAQD